MACIDERIHQFPTGAGPETYTLTVSGPGGAFSASAELQAGGSSSSDSWKPSEIIAPAEKVKQLAADNAYVIETQVTCVATRTKPIRVKASLGAEKYCHEIPCVAGKTLTVINIIVRKP